MTARAGSIAERQDAASSNLDRFDWFADPETFGRVPAAGTGRESGRSLGGEAGGVQAVGSATLSGGVRRGAGSANLASEPLLRRDSD